MKITKDSTVTFRPDFSAKLVGVVWIIDRDNGGDIVGITTRDRNGRNCYRLAYRADLIPA